MIISQVKVVLFYKNHSFDLVLKLTFQGCGDGG